jgi:hypothetical protein
MFLASSLGEGEYTASRLGLFNHLERASSIHRIGGAMDFRANLNGVSKIKSLAAAQKSNPDSSVLQPHSYLQGARGYVVG